MNLLSWIAAESDEPELRDEVAAQPPTAEKASGQSRVLSEPASLDRSVGKFSAPDTLLQGMPAHNFPAAAAPYAESVESALDRNPDVWLYRKRTMSLLRRYMRYSVETGRLPSIVGKEMFRSKLSHYTVATFEDRVIFVRDVERCLEKLNKLDQQIIARIVLQEHSHERAAVILHCTRKTIERRLPEVLDELSEAFLEVRLLEPLPPRENRSAQ